MSWQATAWAVEQKTGSPHSKLLLLLLANRADEDGICWPSQINLAEQSEQSDDTVQRHLKSLEDNHFIRRARNRRAKGRWPGFVYQLLMPGVVQDHEIPKRRSRRSAIKAASEAPTRPLPAARTESQRAARNEPLSAASPSRSQRLHQAAQSGVESSSETSLQISATSEPIISSEPSRVTIAISTVERPKALHGSKQVRKDIIQNQIAQRLGADGWGILMSMNPDQLAQLELLQRKGNLSDHDISNIRSEAKLHALLGPRASAATRL
jgi:hypothetical protein